MRMVMMKVSLDMMRVRPSIYTCRLTIETSLFWCIMSISQADDYPHMSSK